MKITHAMVFFAQDVNKGFDFKSKLLYGVQQKIKAYFGITDYRVYTNFKSDDPHFVYLDNVKGLHLGGRDRVKGDKVPIMKEAVRRSDDNETLLFHDFDAFQNQCISPYLENFCDPVVEDIIYRNPITLTPYNHRPDHVNTGVMFVRGGSSKADKLFELINGFMIERNRCHDEPGFSWMLTQKEYRSQLGLLDYHWNFGKHIVEELSKKLIGKPKFCHIWPPAMLNEFSKLQLMHKEVETILRGVEYAEPIA